VYDEGQLRPLMCDTACAPDYLLNLLRVPAQRTGVLPLVNAEQTTFHAQIYVGAVLKKVYVTIFMHITMMSRIYTDSGEEEED
jgi:hypothetical protein